MENFDDLKAVWRTVPLHGLPSSAEMALTIKKDRKEKLRKLLLVIAGAILLILAAALEIQSLSPNSLFSSKIGIALMILAGILMAATNLNSLYRFYKLDVCGNKDYIAFLKQTKLRQLFYYKRTQPFVVSCATVGLFLYWYELAIENPIIGLAIYVAFTGYVLILLLYVRPKVFKKEQKKLNESIEHVIRISEQF